MQREITKYLFDILTCIDNIESFMGQNKQYDDYKNNMMLQQAVERNLEIIGEAVSGILKIDSGINITDARKMVDTRNKIIHSYDQILPSLIWNIIIGHIPLLKHEVQSLLNN
jgi:uncharacterized protein with HEPN domain